MPDTDPGTGSPAVALQVVVVEKDHSFTLNEKALKRLLLDRRVCNNKVVVLSIAGAFRKGKSYLLDFFLRYLYARGSSNWIGDDDAPLKGFPWKGGSERTTSGILMWSDPFEVTLPNGEKVCILLMDTQGAFDSQSTVKDCATVFALSTMLSSVQIYNIMSNIQEDDLQHLQLFTEYGRLVLEGCKSKPFQDLHFLVRDWSYPYQYKYGTKGGEELLEKRLQVMKGQHQELQQLRHHLRSCFTKIGCYLMPHPGLKVATNPQFDGRLSDIEEDFKQHVQEFVNLLMAPENLVVKEINETKITGKELIEYFKAYIKVFQGDELPEPKSMLEATAEANNLSAVANAKDLYAKRMEEVCGGDKPYLHPDIILREHERCQQEAVNLFQSIRKMGGAEKSSAYLEKLNRELKETYSTYVGHNSAKNSLAFLQTLFTLVAFAVALYVGSSVFGVLGMEFFGDLMCYGMWLVIAVCIIWGYSLVTGKFVAVGATVNNSTLYVRQLGIRYLNKVAASVPTNAKKTQ